MPVNVNNEQALSVVLFGTETIPGQAVTPTGRLFGEFVSTKNRALRRREEATGLYDRFVSPSREQATYAGTYGEDLTYESFPALLRYAVKSGGTGSLVGGSTAAYQYVKSPSGSVDDIDSMTVQYGVDGLGFQSTGVRFNEFTVAADSTDGDDVWKWSSNLFLRDKVRLPGGFDGVLTAATATSLTMTGAAWVVDDWEGGWVTLDTGSHTGQVRRIASNTADTLTLEGPALSPVPVAGDTFHIAAQFPVVATPDIETIQLEGTKLFLDRYNAVTSAIGTTDVSERLLSFNVTQTLNLAAKRRLPGIIGRVGRGARWITGTIRFEFDHWDEYRGWEEDEEISIRIEQEGSEVEPGVNRLARIDVERAAWDAPSPDTDNNNMTMSLSFVAALPEAEPIATFTAVNGEATLP